MQFLHYQLYQEGLKGFFYSVKLKLELNILSKLVDLVNGNAAHRTTSLGFIDVDTIPGQAPSDLQREVSPMEQPIGWRPSYSKGILENVKEDHLDQPKLEDSTTNPLDDSNGIMRLTSEQTSFSSRTRGRESDVWYAEMLRSMK